jgi:hypothetical protein
MLNDLVIVFTAVVSSEYTVKYNAHKFLPPKMAANIHPVWLIDEYVKIFRSYVRFIPLKEPTTTDIMMIVRVRGFILIK